MGEFEGRTGRDDGDGSDEDGGRVGCALSVFMGGFEAGREGVADGPLAVDSTVGSDGSGVFPPLLVAGGCHGTYCPSLKVEGDVVEFEDELRGTPDTPSVVVWAMAVDVAEHSHRRADKLSPGRSIVRDVLCLLVPL